jgi:hypothetical protein
VLVQVSVWSVHHATTAPRSTRSRASTLCKKHPRLRTTRSEARTRSLTRPPTSRYRPEPPRPRYSPPQIGCDMSRSRYTTPQNRATSLLPRSAGVESGAFTHRKTDSTRSVNTSSILIARSTSLFSRPPRSTGPSPSGIVHNVCTASITRSPRAGRPQQR